MHCPPYGTRGIKSSFAQSHFRQSVGIEQQRKTPLPEVNPLVARAGPDNCISSPPTHPSVCVRCDCLTAVCQENPGTAPRRPGELGAQQKRYVGTYVDTYRQDGVWTGVEEGT